MMPYLQFILALQMCSGTMPALPASMPAPRRSFVQQAARDRWFAEDKLKHAMMSMAAVNFTYAGARFVGLQDDSALITAALAGAAAGIWKEAHDQRIGRPFSARDLVWDALGIGIGLVLVSNAR
jgi:hypothetical protein